jgi:single-stranded-DNA-specific exonuclease
VTREHVQREFRAFLQTLLASSRLAVVGHSDTDGLTATAILTRALDSAGYSTAPTITQKGENAWSDAVLRRAADGRPDALLVLDLGSRADPLLPGVPALLIDHHKPTGVPPGAVLISGYGTEPTPSSGLLAYWCAEALGATAGMDWLAAASMLADYGSTDAFPETRNTASITVLRRVTALLNAPRRTAAGDATVALELLLNARTPDDLLRQAAPLEAAKQEVDAAFARARKTAPRFIGEVAIIEIDEGCQVHPLVAQTWRTRLRKNIVLCANRGYLPGRVNFAMRTALDCNLLEFLAEHRPPGAGEDYGRGHPKATGGSLTDEDWRWFLQSLESARH